MKQFAETYGFNHITSSPYYVSSKQWPNWTHGEDDQKPSERSTRYLPYTIGFLSGPHRGFVTRLSFTLPNLAKVALVVAVTSAPVSSLKITGWSMLTIQQESFSQWHWGRSHLDLLPAGCLFVPWFYALSLRNIDYYGDLFSCTYGMLTLLLIIC